LTDFQISLIYQRFLRGQMRSNSRIWDDGRARHRQAAVWSKPLVWIAYAPLTAVLLLFLAVMQAGERLGMARWRLKRLAIRTPPDDRPLRPVWTPSRQPRKPGW
jgi:hypothetical protein